MKKYLCDIYKRKDLLTHLVVSGLKAQNRNTYLGYIWWVLDPLLMGVIFYLARVILFGMEGENVGAFLVIGLIAWKWITAVLSASAKSISGKAGIITQVYLPKAIFPLGSVFTQMLNFSMSLVVIALFLIFYRIIPDYNLFWLPVIMAVQSLFLTALSLILAYTCMFIRDIENVLSHVTRFWFWTTPVIWEAEILPAQYQHLLAYNPAAVLLNSYRNILMYQAAPEWQNLLIIGGLSLVVSMFMFYFYNRNEHKIIRAI